KITKYRINSVSSAVFQQLSIRSGSEKILAISHSKTHELSKLKIDRDSLILVLEAPEKPGNIGALYRTATAAQMDAVLIANPKTDFYNPNSIRSSLGSQFLMPTAIATSEQVVSFLRKNQFQIATAALHPDAIPYDTFDYTPPCAVVMGTESTGLNKEWLENTDQHLIIPMDKSIDSLNLSVSAGILMYEAIRHKKSLN
ncbi:MAG: RNA methyltransferase, partial [Flavobacteriaceae bacterium]